ncbi:MAG: SUMF1/EgtB/PvdO family nonheme iron enzyme [Treponema sp.]|nr:SUMF1/EgtB/PvdO family nonheme iron enzyme [Treponema sp.]
MISKKKTNKTAPGNREKAGNKSPAQSKPDEALPEDRVVLPPVLGVRPGVYLAVLYSLVILGVLFFTLVYPGLSEPGSVAVFRSEPAGAAVRIDGTYRGTTPCEVFVPKGKRVFEFVLPGFTPVTREAEITGRVFASAFAPRRRLVTAALKAGYPLEPLVLGAADFSEWSLAGEPTAAYQIPMSLSEGAYQAGPAAADPSVREAMNGVLDAALRFTVTRAGLRDFLRAKFLLDNQGLSPSPVSALASARDLIFRLSQTPGAAAVLGDYLPPEAAAAVKDSAWYRKSAAAPDRAGLSSPAAAAEGSIEAGGLRFKEIAGGVFITGGNVPRRVSLGDFYIAGTAVSPSSWEAFLAANPLWDLQHAPALREQGLVTEDYLVSFTSGPADLGISSVSWYAAEAYCTWLTSLLPPALSSYEVRLPAEAEWEYALTVHGEIRELGRSLWEWCSDPYVPLDFLSAPEEVAALVGSPERSIRGGSWVNQPGSVNIATRASLPPRFCSPFVSFRPVIALKEGAGYE